MKITINVTQEQLASIRQGLMCAASISTDNGHKQQAHEFHDVHNALPDPWFPAKPELPPLRDTSGDSVPVTTVKNTNGPDTYLCRACGTSHLKWDDALDCWHPEDKRAEKEIKRLEYSKPENWEYLVFALRANYLS